MCCMQKGQNVCADGVRFIHKFTPSKGGWPSQLYSSVISTTAVFHVSCTAVLPPFLCFRSGERRAGVKDTELDHSRNIVVALGAVGPG